MRATILGEKMDMGSSGWQVLRDSILFAQAHLRTVQKRIGSDSGRKPADHLRSCLHHLENIASAANEGNLANLHRLCEEMWRHLKTLTVDNETTLSLTLQSMLTWTTDVLAHLEEPDNAALLQRLLAPLPEDRQHSLQRALGIEAVNPQVDTSFPDDNIDDTLLDSRTTAGDRDFLEHTMVASDGAASAQLSAADTGHDDFHPDLMPQITDISAMDLKGDLTQPLTEDTPKRAPTPVPVAEIQHEVGTLSVPDDGAIALLENSLSGGIEDFAEIRKILAQAKTRQELKDCRQALILLLDNIESYAVLAGITDAAAGAGAMLDALRHYEEDADPMVSICAALPAWCSDVLGFVQQYKEDRLAAPASVSSSEIPVDDAGVDEEIVLTTPPDAALPDSLFLDGEPEDDMVAPDLPQFAAAPFSDDAFFDTEEIPDISMPFDDAVVDLAAEMHQLMGDTDIPEPVLSISPDADDMAADVTASASSADVPEFAEDAEDASVGAVAMAPRYQDTDAGDDGNAWLISDDPDESVSGDLVDEIAAFNAALLATAAGTDDAMMGMSDDDGIETPPPVATMDEFGDVVNDLDGVDMAAFEAAMADGDMDGIFLPASDAGDDAIADFGRDEAETAAPGDGGAEHVLNDLAGIDAADLDAVLNAEDMHGIFLPTDESALDAGMNLGTGADDAVLNDLEGIDMAALEAEMDGDIDGVLLPPSAAHTETGDEFALDDDLDFAPDAEFGPDEEFNADNILDVLRAEIMEVSPQLAKLESIITSSADPTALHNAIRSYSELTERLMLASESLGLTGLYEVCRFAQDNINRMSAFELHAREQVAPVLARWTALVLTYLQNPADDSSCVMLLNHFQDKAWPKPISGEKGRDLYVMLSKGMDESVQPEPVPERQRLASAEDVALEISADASKDLIDAFFMEAPAQTERFSLTIALIAAGENLAENVKVAQRIAHTLKGSGNLIGIRGLANLTHHVEDILEYLSTHRMAPPKSLAELMIETADCLEGMLDALQGKGPAPADALSLLQRILDWANRVDKGEIRESDVGSLSGATQAPNAAPMAAAVPESETAPDMETRGQALETLRVPTTTVDDMIGLLGEVSIAIAQVKEHINRLLQRGKSMGMQEAVIQQRRFDLENMVGVRSQSTMQRRLRRLGPQNSENFDPLEMDQYDELYGTTHSFIEAVADSREVSHQIQSELSTLEGLFLQQQRLNKELQQLVMTTRMEAANTLSSRLQRAVRQACRATGKKVDLVLENEDMHIDSDVLAKLADPLMHMLRNAVDHGIEAEDLRRQKGKPEAGTITLSYSREGNNFVVRCGDDGGGLNYEKIRETAVKKGLLGDKENLDKRDLGRMILVPGFSTRDTTTQISGRGVGMDVVHAAILELKGSLDIVESEQGGTEFVMRLPVSLVTSHSLVVKTGEDLFAVPTNYLLQILAPDTGEVTEIGGQVAFQLGNDIFPARSLAEMVNSTLGDRNISSKKIILLVKADTGNYAVTVDQLINSYELVIKGTGKYVQKVPGVAGVAVLGDGNVVPVLDLPEMLRSSHGGISAKATTLPSVQAVVKAKAGVQDVLIVDDSLSVRKSLAMFVKDAGFNPVLARDGLEAAELLRKQKVAIALVDMEMPRMNGLELTRHIRATEELKSLPVIMITSRTQQKHRQQAEQAGVNRYLSKPYGEDDLLAAIEQLMGR